MDQSSKKLLDENARLMRKVADGNIEAFDCLHQRFAPFLKQFFVIRRANNDSADDLVQKIFTSLWKRRKNYRVESSFESYLYSMARNTLYQEIRRSRRITGKNLKKQPKSELDTHDVLSPPEAELYFKEISDAIEAAKAKLTTEQRQAIDAFQDQDIALDKTSEQNICSKGAYKSRLQRARKRIMEILAPFFTDIKRHKKC